MLRGLPAFEPVYRALSAIAVYNPVPDEIRGFKPERRYRNLDRTGSALAETIFRLKATAPEPFNRVIEYLRKITPSVLDVDAVSVDANYNLRFDFVGGSNTAEEFPSQNVSDGTLRALAVLVALFQTNDRYPLTLIGLEEPEAGLHPAAAGVLFDSLVEASHFGQIVVTSHSPDLLNRDDIPEDAIKAVENVRRAYYHRASRRPRPIGVKGSPLHGRRTTAHESTPTGRYTRLHRCPVTSSNSHS